MRSMKVGRKGGSFCWSSVCPGRCEPSTVGCAGSLRVPLPERRGAKPGNQDARPKCSRLRINPGWENRKMSILTGETRHRQAMITLSRPKPSLLPGNGRSDSGAVECRWFQKQTPGNRDALDQSRPSAHGARANAARELGEFFSACSAQHRH